MYSSNKYNELMYVNFIELSPKGLCLITQKQADKLLKDGVRFFNPKTQQIYEILKDEDYRCVIRLSDLEMSSDIIAKLNLENAFVQILFFNGLELFKR